MTQHVVWVWHNWTGQQVADVRHEAAEVYQGHVGLRLVGTRRPWGVLSRGVKRSDWWPQTAFVAQDQFSHSPQTCPWVWRAFLLFLWIVLFFVMQLMTPVGTQTLSVWPWTSLPEAYLFLISIRDLGQEMFPSLCTSCFFLTCLFLSWPALHTHLWNEHSYMTGSASFRGCRDEYTRTSSWLRQNY